MVTKEEKKIEALKLEHEEKRLFLQIIWGGLLSFIISLVIAAFSNQTSFTSERAVWISVVGILGGIILTLVVFSKKFNEIRDKISDEYD